MRAFRLSNERGIALAVAIFALVVVGALVAATFFAGQLEQRTGQNTIYASQAAEAAEAGLSQALASQTAASMGAMVQDPTKAVDLPPITVGSSKLTAAATITRLNETLFLVRSTGTRQDAGGNPMAVRALGQLIQLLEANISVKAGLTARGNVKISGGAYVQGKDAVPSAWINPLLEVNCPTLADQTGVRYNNGTVTKNGGGDYDGVPPSTLDPTLTAASMKATFDQLKALKTLTVNDDNPSTIVPVYTPTVPAKCDLSSETNWGEPTPLTKTDPCFSYYPIIYHYGNLKLQNGRGQGILLVEGDLTTTGSVVFYGPVFVLGTLSTSGNSGQGAKFFGGVVAGNVDLDDITKLTGGALVNYSSCAIDRALKGSAVPTPVAERSWIQLYN